MLFHHSGYVEDSHISVPMILFFLPLKASSNAFLLPWPQSDAKLSSHMQT